MKIDKMEPGRCPEPHFLIFITSKRSPSHLKGEIMSKFNWVALNRNYEDIIYETYNGIAKITINRPEVRNAFRPKTVVEMIDAFSIARDDTNVGVIILTGANHGKGEDKEAFCSGGDQKFVEMVVMLVKTKFLV